ncbi:MAG: DUF4390 domain-containing protein [bacterium]
MKNKMFSVLKWAAPVLLLAAFLGGPARSATTKAEEPQIRDLLVIENRGRLLVFGTLDSGFSPKLIEAVQSGVAARFVFEILLMRARRLIYDTEVRSLTLTHQVKYDALKKAYTLTFRQEPGETSRKITRKQKQMIDWMAELNGEPFAQVRDLAPGSRYYIRVRAKVNTVDFSFPFNYLLSFLGTKTAWAESSVFGPKGM